MIYKYSFKLSKMITNSKINQYLLVKNFANFFFLKIGKF